VQLDLNKWLRTIAERSFRSFCYKTRTQWKIDSRLDEQALKELAYAMGHSLETMIKLYVRHRSPGSTGALEAVIGELLHTQAAPWLSDNIQATQIRQIMGLVRSLSADNQKALLPWIQELLTEGEQHTYSNSLFVTRLN